MKIITLTLSPAFDLHCYAEGFGAGRECLAKILQRQAGGKGVNISRALRANGVENTPFVLLGSENGDEFKRCLDGDGLTAHTLTVDGRIRENITLHTESGEETRISFEGFSAEPSVLEKLLELLDGVGLEGTFITFTGRAPTGIDASYIRQFLLSLKKRGAELVIDSRSLTLSDIIACSPYLIKPNEEEISAYMGKGIATLSDAAEAAEGLHSLGIMNAMVTLGGAGAVLVSDGGVWAATPPKIEVLSTIGAGDSAIAGFLSAVSAGLDTDEALRHAVAFGSAACLTEGTLPPRKKDIDRIISQVKINRI